MSVTVEPSTFSIVNYDASEIAGVAQEILDRLGMGSSNLSIEVDERIALSRVTTQTGDPILLHVLSSAFENQKHPREFSPGNTRLALGRGLLRVRDRLSGTFESAPSDEDLSIVESAVWETYCVGRLDRLGLKINRQRWHYNFRNRHGFTDSADRGFDQIWNADNLTWLQLMEISRSCTA